MTSSRKWLAALALPVSVGIAIAGCSTTGDDDGAPVDGGTDGGVPYGASIEEYHAAFEGIDPITLQVQAPGGPGASTAIDLETYGEAIEEWSNGVVSFEMHYANSVAGPTEVHHALSDGRLDMAYLFPGYVPDVLPLNAQYSALSILGTKTPVAASLAPYLWVTESFYEFEDEHTAEYEDAGVYALMPVLATNIPVISCNEPNTSLADFSGNQITTTSAARVIQAEALGMSGVTLGFQEAFEGLQRGVVGCTMSSAAGAVLGGFPEVAPFVATSDNEAITTDLLPLGFSLDRWESLPLVVKQLLFDRLDVLIDADVHAALGDMATLHEMSAEHGGEFLTLAPDAESALADANERIIESVRSTVTVVDGDALVDFVTERAADADATVAGLGYSDDAGYLGFAEAYDPDTLDLGPFIEYFMTEVLLPHRPS